MTPSSSRHLLDPQLAAAIEQLPAMPLTRENLVARRAAYAQLMETLLPQLPPIDGVAVSEQQAPSSDGAPPVRVLVYRPERYPGVLPVLLWIHGGGYVSGRAEWDAHYAKSLVRDVGCCVVSVAYRLAPETPYPGAVEDCYAALQWIDAQAGKLGFDPAHVGVAGMSAGGGLAAALALLARDRGGPALCFQALLQPMLDDRTTREDRRHPFDGEFIWTHQQNQVGWSALLGVEPGNEGVSPYAAAARAASLAHLPPTFIAVGALDLFVEENLDYARRLIRAGVPTELHVYPAVGHAFQFLAPACRAAIGHEHALIHALRRGLDLAPMEDATRTV